MIVLEIMGRMLMFPLFIYLYFLYIYLFIFLYINEVIVKIGLVLIAILYVINSCIYIAEDRFL
jgi:hypothetical protein